jgi:lipopolysaccharide/colanic/teichoic acid biosynthesis glycosyltransferase
MQPARTVPVDGFEAVRPAFLGFAKRATDIVFSALAIVLLSPLFALVALMVKLDSRGPIVFRSRRIGQNGEAFDMLKFRTMVVDADLQRDDLRHLSQAPDGLFKIEDDPRLTRLGHWIRSTSLDEMPQLFQVLSGTMSLVGPRPLPPEEDALIEGADLRREARPGLTGPWQVAGSWRIPLAEMVEMDDEYLTNWSLWLDARIVGQTFLHVLQGRGC